MKLITKPINEGKFEVLREGKDFTMQGLINFLNLNFSERYGKTFQRKDIEYYLKKGFLPKKLANIGLEKITNHCISLDFIRLHDLDGKSLEELLLPVEVDLEL